MKTNYTAHICELGDEPLHTGRDYSQHERIHCRVPLKVASTFKMIILFKSIDNKF